MEKPLVIAHRGDSSSALENSLEAFRLALALPVDIIEFDIRMSRDEVLYVMHDRQSGRTAECNIDLEKASSGEISRIMLRNGEPVPRLEDALALVSGKAGINIEIKSDGAGAVLARFLSEHPYNGFLMVSSFKEAELLALRKRMPDIPVALVYDAFSTRHLPDYVARGYNRISLRKNTVSEPLVRACQTRGVQIFVWTVDDEAEMQRCVEWNVDGIYTNKPRILKDLIEGYRKTGSGK